MFPWTDGFRWTVNHIVFLCLFFVAIFTIATTVLCAMRRAVHDLQTRSAAEICWQADFADLPNSERRCRHELAGRVISRKCDSGFNCRECSQFSQFSLLPALHSGNQMGFDYSPNRFYHRGHTWVEPQPDGTVTIGLDELADRLVGTPDFFESPAVGARIELNGTAWRMKKNGREIRVRAPIEGTVLATRGVNHDWCLKIQPLFAPADPTTFRHLLQGPEVQGWLNRELERLQFQLRAPNTTPTLADGGVLIHGVMDALPEADWDTVLAGTFLES